MLRNSLKDVLGDLESFESEKEIKVVKDGVLEETLAALFEVYKRKLATAKLAYGFNEPLGRFYESCLKSMPSKHELTKKVVDEFVLRVVKYDNEWGFKHYTGYFITALVQTSFRQGNNNFELQLVSAEPINYLGAELRGWKDRRLKLTIRNLAEYSNDIRSQPLCWLIDLAYVDATILGMNVVPPMLGINCLDCTFTSDNEGIADNTNGTFCDAGSETQKSEIKTKDVLQMRIALEA